MLKVQFKDGRQPGLWLVDQRVSVGKESTNKLVINDATISPVHAEFIQEKSWWYIEDRGSKHGTYVNGELLSGRFQLRAGDEIRLGNVDLVLVDSAQASMKGKPQAAKAQTPWMLQGMSGDVRGKFYPLMGSLTLGRADDCGICIKLDTISRHHCELTVGPSGLRIKDLGSANGTQVNMKKVSESVLKAGDKINLEGTAFLVIGPKTEVDEDDDSERTVFKAVEAPPPPPKPELAAATKPQVIADPVLINPTVVHAEPQNYQWIWAAAGALVVILGAAVIFIMR